MANAITNLNNLLENERHNSRDLLMENLSLKNQIHDLKWKNENMLLSRDNPDERDSIRKIAVRSELINAADCHNNLSNEKALSKEQLTTEKETNPDGNDKSTSTKAKKMNKNKDCKCSNTSQRVNNTRDKNKVKLQTNNPRNAEAGGTGKRLGGSHDRSTAGKKLKVLVVGDSQLRQVKGEKLDNDHRNVEIRFKPGMKIEEVTKKVDTSEEWDVIIVHVKS